MLLDFRFKDNFNCTAHISTDMMTFTHLAKRPLAKKSPTLILLVDIINLFKRFKFFESKCFSLGECAISVSALILLEGLILELNFSFFVNVIID